MLSLRKSLSQVRSVDVKYEILFFSCSRSGNTVKHMGPTITFSAKSLKDYQAHPPPLLLHRTSPCFRMFFYKSD
jgi:hypothetical protein